MCGTGARYIDGKTHRQFLLNDCIVQTQPPNEYSLRQQLKKQKYDKRAPNVYALVTGLFARRNRVKGPKNKRSTDMSDEVGEDVDDDDDGPLEEEYAGEVPDFGDIVEEPTVDENTFIADAEESSKDDEGPPPPTIERVETQPGEMCYLCEKNEKRRGGTTCAECWSFI